MSGPIHDKSVKAARLQDEIASPIVFEDFTRAGPVTTAAALGPFQITLAGNGTVTLVPDPGDERPGVAQLLSTSPGGADSAALSAGARWFPSGDHVVDMRTSIRVPAATSVGTVIFGGLSANTDFARFSINLATNVVTATSESGTTFSSALPAALPRDQWVQLRILLTGDAVIWYVDGVEVASTSLATDIPAATSEMAIGLSLGAADSADDQIVLTDYIAVQTFGFIGR